jgi:hypothetical protein
MTRSPDPSAAAAAARRPKQKRQTKKRIHAPPPTVVGAFSPPAFLAAHGGLSPAMYFKMKKQGKAPKEMRIGRRVLISFESAAAWRAEREAEL